MDKDDKELERLIWQAFETSGKPGYYMLYKALHKEEKDGH